jgi:hypothetical protein
MCFEGIAHLPWSSNAERSFDAESMQPASRGDGLNQTIGAPRQSVAGTSNCETHTFDALIRLPGLRAPGGRGADQREAIARRDSDPRQGELSGCNRQVEPITRTETERLGQRTGRRALNPQ